MKKIFYIISFSFIVNFLFANEMETDSIQSILLDEFSVFTNKETNSENAPVSSSILDSEKINQTQLFSTKDISAKVPNFYMPDYGSAMSNSPYVRGVGSRYSGQSIALYVDNVPYLEKTAFDFELFDIALIEVLRGPQGTLYGRNSIGGLVNIHTLSPLNYQGTKVSISGGNFGQINGRISHYQKLNKAIGFSIGAYYKHHDGFFKNDYTNQSADKEDGAGGRAKLTWNASNRLKFDYILDVDYINQGAFPYGLYDENTKKVNTPNFNDKSNYFRTTINNSFTSRYIFDKMLATLSLSHQYFDDQMDIDQDFTPESIFTLQQNQIQNLYNTEALLKSSGKGNYQWIFGINGFNQQHDLEAPVKFKRDGITKYIESALPPVAKITNDVIDIPGTYDTKRSGAALFHQSTLDNIFIEGLSATIGLRLDADKVALKYDSNSEMTLKMPPYGEMSHQATLKGTVDTLFLEILPKFSLKYGWNKGNFIYGSFAKGYKTGGFNIHEISDIVRDALNPRNPQLNEDEVKARIMYRPETSWNYEMGWNNTFADQRIKTNITLFFMKINGLQLTEFLESGAGRKLTNAGKAVSKGVEASMDIDLGSGFYWDINYGFAHASFKHYLSIENGNTVDYSGKLVPYAPQNTVNTNLSYQKTWNKGFINGFIANIAWSGIGKIYWNESNDLYDDFYNTTDFKLGVKKNNIRLDIWGKNIFNTSYNTFYFESFGNKFFQKGKPTQLGMTVSYTL